MGLFDRKRTDPQPEPAAHQPEPEPQRKEPAPVKKAPEKAVAEKAVAEKAVAPRPSGQSDVAKPAYGIQNAIELMRQLPNDNVNLVVEVVKKTLESLQVDIPAIIADAERKHERIDARAAKLQVEIRDYEEEIAARRDEIKALTADRDETQVVKERLDLALKLATSSRPAAAAAAAASASKPAPQNLPAPGEVDEGKASASWGSTKVAGTLGAEKLS